MRTFSLHPLISLSTLTKCVRVHVDQTTLVARLVQTIYAAGGQAVCQIMGGVEPPTRWQSVLFTSLLLGHNRVDCLGPTTTIQVTKRASSPAISMAVMDILFTCSAFGATTSTVLREVCVYYNRFTKVTASRSKTFWNKFPFRDLQPFGVF